jgi:hypothetical protein
MPRKIDDFDLIFLNTNRFTVLPSTHANFDGMHALCQGQSDMVNTSGQSHPATGVGRVYCSEYALNCHAE